MLNHGGGKKSGYRKLYYLQNYAGFSPDCVTFSLNTDLSAFKSASPFFYASFSFFLILSKQCYGTVARNSVFLYF